MKIGVLVYMHNDIAAEFRKVKDMGFTTCQLCCWEDYKYTNEFAQKVNSAAKEYGIEINSFWCGWEGPGGFAWNFYEGPATLGLVPAAYRMNRMNNLMKGSDFVEKIGVSDFITHAGFIPENPNDPDYWGTVYAVRGVANKCRSNGQNFLFETGQETPVTLLRTIEDIGLDNLGINLDPANLLMYGKANPVDALDVFGKYVKQVHAKDGEYPVNGKFLGEEKALGKGRVNFPALVSKLKEIGYSGPLNIEREISGEQQIRDIQEAREFLNELI